MRHSHVPDGAFPMCTYTFIPTHFIPTLYPHTVSPSYPHTYIHTLAQGHLRMNTIEVFSPPKYRCSMLTILDLNVDDMSRCSPPEIHPNVGDMLNVGRKPTLRAAKSQSERSKPCLTDLRKPKSMVSPNSEGVMNLPGSRFSLKKRSGVRVPGAKAPDP